MSHGSRGLKVLAGALATLVLAIAAAAQTRECPIGTQPTLTGGCAPAPPQSVSYPDMALQFSECQPLLIAPEIVPPEVVYLLVDQTLRDGVRGALQQLDANEDDYHCALDGRRLCNDDSDCNNSDPYCPDCPPDRCLGPEPEVRHACANGKLTFGVWFKPLGGYGTWDNATARNAGLSRVTVLAAGENFGFFFGAAGISRLVDIAWRDQPRTLNDAGAADPDGPVHLTAVRPPSFYADDGRAVVELAIDGWYQGPTSQTDITARVWDYLTLTSNGYPTCDTDSRAEPIETTLDTILNYLFGNAGPIGGLVDEGPGCRMARLLPKVVLLPGRPPKKGIPGAGAPEKLVYTYTRIASIPGGVQNSGVTFAGTWDRRARVPRVSEIVGPGLVLPSEFQDYEGPNLIRFEATYGLDTDDMRPPLTALWFSQDAAPVPNSPLVTLVWTIPRVGGAPGVFREIVVIVIDADGLVAVGRRWVVLRFDPLPDVEDEITPICLAKPWLPECQ